MWDILIFGCKKKTHFLRSVSFFIVTVKEKYKLKISDYVWEIEYNNDFEIDLSPLVKNIDKYNKRIEVVPFYMNVQKEGIILYGG